MKEKLSVKIFNLVRTKSISEAFLILAVSIIIGLSANGFRAEGGVPYNVDWYKVIANQKQSQFASSNISTISVNAAMAFDELSEAIFLDARTQDEFKQGHIPNAKLFPPEIAEELLDALARGEQYKSPDGVVYSELLGSLEKGQVYIAYCSGLICNKAEKIAQMLTEAGYNTLLMPAGLDGWLANGGKMLEVQRN